MSDSEDDLPLAKRQANAAPQPPQRKAAPKRSLADFSDTDSDEDQPLAKKKAVPKQSKPAEAKAVANNSSAKASAKASNGKAAPATNGTADKPKKARAPANKEPRVAKVYDLPGQTRETPEENDALRRFYTSLLEQIPESAMAKKWCVMHGLLPADEAQAWLDEQKGGKGRTPTKASAPRVKKEAASGKDAKTKAKRKSDAGKADNDDDSPTPVKKVSAKAKQVIKKEKIKIEDSDSDDDVPLANRIQAAR